MRKAVRTRKRTLALPAGAARITRELSEAKEAEAAAAAAAAAAAEEEEEEEEK
eukprot:COSAG06_NODE_5477_length_3455_cov_29.898391_2_plen_53_part_00